MLSPDEGNFPFVLLSRYRDNLYIVFAIVQALNSCHFWHVSCLWPLNSVYVSCWVVGLLAYPFLRRHEFLPLHIQFRCYEQNNYEQQPSSRGH